MGENVTDAGEEETYQQAYQRSLGNLRDSKDGRTAIWTTLFSLGLITLVLAGVLFGNFLYEPNIERNIVNPNGAQTVQTQLNLFPE